MAKGLLGGMTDYSHQSFTDILRDLEDEQKRTATFRDAIQINIDQLLENGYWKSSVPHNFKNIVDYSLHHYNTTIDEIADIRKDILNEVKDHHVNRLQKIANVADKINVDIGKIWHQQYTNKDYGDSKFHTVETIYSDTRDMAVNLLDISNIAERLKDFIGKTISATLPPKKKKLELGHKIAIGSLIVAIIVLLFGNNLYDRFFNSSNPSIANDSVKVSQVIADTILLSQKLPYLENYPIIDNGIYVKYYFNNLLFGGVNVDTIQINARTISGEGIDLKKEGEYVSMNISSEPFIEFEYKGKFYSIEVTGIYSFTMTLKEIIKPTMKLKRFSEL